MSSQWNDINGQLNQMSKTKAAEWLSYKRQLMNAGRDDIVANVEQLVDIGVSEGAYTEGTPAGTHARKIGADIDRVGGFRMMQEIHKLFVLALFAKGEDYENAASLSRKLGICVGRYWQLA